MKLKMMYSFLNSDLNVIENELEETIKAESPLLHQASLHLLQAGGKESAQFSFCWLRSSENTILIKLKT